MNDNGRIIVIGSVNGDVMLFAGGAAYALTKSAVQGMVRGLARLRRARHHRQRQPIGAGRNRHEPRGRPMAEFVHSFMATKRHARTDEIAELAAYIAGPHGAMMTGAMHTIDGGMGA